MQKELVRCDACGFDVLVVEIKGDKRLISHDMFGRPDRRRICQGSERSALVIDLGRIELKGKP